MLESLKDNYPIFDECFKDDVDRSFVKFCEKMGSVFEIRDFLLTLKAQIPKRFKTGELLFFYESEQLGLRRAYVRNSVFYEESAQNLWPSVKKISFSFEEQNLYLAREFGRAFFKSLVIPFHSCQSEIGALLFVEIRSWGQTEKALMDFFQKRELILRLIFKRVFLNTRFSRISYLWSQLFTHWWEPLAILQNFQVVLLNNVFKKNLPLSADFFKQKNLPEKLEIEGKTYCPHYYPISQFKNSKPIGVLYCQDMTKHFHLKEQLFQSEKMASLYELGKNMAHQLNNPLTGVHSMAQILCRNPEMADFREDLLEVEKAVQRSYKIIENLLFFSQLQEKQKICNLNKAVSAVLPLLKGAIRGLKVEINLFEESVDVKGDLSILQQVAYNLILNSCQALQGHVNKERPCIQISTNKISKTQAALKIRDNGPGIAPYNMEKIFQPFWTNKKKGQGTGFGLGIARKFVQQFGGEIFVSSKEGEFACFTVVLPLQS